MLHKAADAVERFAGQPARLPSRKQASPRLNGPAQSAKCVPALGEGAGRVKARGVLQVINRPEIPPIKKGALPADGGQCPLLRLWSC